MPYFGSSVFITFCAYNFIINGNAWFPVWAFYGLLMVNWKVPKRLFGIESGRSDENFDVRKAQSSPDWYFRIPLYCYVILETLFWFYILVLTSDKVSIPNEMLASRKPKTMFESCAIYFLIGWLSAITSALGHELVHKKNICDKMIG